MRGKAWDIKSKFNTKKIDYFICWFQYIFLFTSYRTSCSYRIPPKAGKCVCKCAMRSFQPPCWFSKGVCVGKGKYHVNLSGKRGGSRLGREDQLSAKRCYEGICKPINYYTPNAIFSYLWNMVSCPSFSNRYHTVDQARAEVHVSGTYTRTCQSRHIILPVDHRAWCCMPCSLWCLKRLPRPEQQPVGTSQGKVTASSQVAVGSSPWQFRRKAINNVLLEKKIILFSSAPFRKHLNLLAECSPFLFQAWEKESN